MSLSKFEKDPAETGATSCERNRLAKAGWLWRKQSKDELRQKYNYFDNGDETKLKTFTQTMEDQVAYNLGCGLLMDRSVENSWQQYKSFGAYSTVGEAAWMCASHSSLCGMGGVAGYIEAADSTSCQAACRSDTADHWVTGKGTPIVLPPFWKKAIKKMCKKKYMMKKQVRADVYTGGIDPATGKPTIKDDFELGPLSEIGAVVTKTTEKWESIGVVVGSVLTELNGDDMLDEEFSEVKHKIGKKILKRAKDKKVKPLEFWFAPPRACTEETMDEIFKEHELVEDKNKMHLYVSCLEEDTPDNQAQAKNPKKKISCDPRECQGDDWCFVKSGCGGWGNTCSKIEDPGPCQKGGLKRLPDDGETNDPVDDNEKDINEKYNIPQSAVDECIRQSKAQSIDGKLDEEYFNNCIRGW